MLPVTSRRSRRRRHRHEDRGGGGIPGESASVDGRRVGRRSGGGGGRGGLGLHLDEEGPLVCGAVAPVGAVPVVVLLHLAPPLAGLVGLQVLEADAALVQGGASVWIPGLSIWLPPSLACLAEPILPNFHLRPMVRD